MDETSQRPGPSLPEPGPLSRFIPPFEQGTLATWLPRVAAPGSWVLDPFGIAPQLPLEAARLGYRVLVTANNPITRFLLEMAASPPAEADFKGGLADLAASRKGETLLEAHLQSMYLTLCANCGREVQAESFLWRKAEDAPYARVYACPHCADAGERPVTPEDLERVRSLAAADALHRSRALERVASLDDDDRTFADDAIRHYLPRPLYVITTIINRLEALDLSAERRRALTALVLFACDAGNTLWGHPYDRARPKQLNIPAHFREFNLWMVLERGLDLWASPAAAVPLATWPNRIPDEGGICIFEGRLRDLAHEVRREIPIAATAGALPRSNQAFWTLCALWAGWLWGRAAAEPFQVALRRRRYDWAWSTTALHAAFVHLFELLPLGTPVIGLIHEPEPQFISAAVIAGEAAGLDLQEIKVRGEDEPVQVFWQRGESLPRAARPPDHSLTAAAAEAHLLERGEPAAYLHLHAAAMVALDQARALRPADQAFDETLRITNNLIQAPLDDKARFVHYSSAEGLETGLWGLHPDLLLAKSGSGPLESLADRVEAAVVSLLQTGASWPFTDIVAELVPRFHGLTAPPSDLVRAVLSSYADRQEDGRWVLRPEDAPAARKHDLERVSSAIEAIGKRLQFNTRRDADLIYWQEKNTNARIFLLLTSARMGRALSEFPHPPEKTLIVMPGGRAALVAYKAQRDPTLQQRLKPYRLLKFRLLRVIAQLAVLTRASFEEQIASDPVEQAQGQMIMF